METVNNSRKQLLKDIFTRTEEWLDFTDPSLRTLHFGLGEQVRHRSDCASAQFDQSSLFALFRFLQIPVLLMQTGNELNQTAHRPIFVHTNCTLPLSQPGSTQLPQRFRRNPPFMLNIILPCRVFFMLLYYTHNFITHTSQPFNEGNSLLYAPNGSGGLAKANLHGYIIGSG